MTRTAPPPASDPLSPGLSLYLDALRIAAAFTVFFSHMAWERVTGGRWDWMLNSWLGRDAVVVFFVLSGLIIARSALRPGATGGAYLFDRMTRLWSVAIPALLLGWALDQVGMTLSPEAYEGRAYSDITFAQTLGLGLTFANEWWWFGKLLGSNGPYWSMSYEAAYYVLFAAAVFLRGWTRVASLLIGAVVVGPSILAYAPAWLLGVLVWSWLRAGRLPRGMNAWLCAVIPPAIFAWAVSIGLSPISIFLVFDMLGMEQARALRFATSAPWGTVVALLLSVHLLGMAVLLRGRAVGEMRWLRWVAGGTFSLYLVHAPVLQFLWSRLDWMEATVLRDAVLIVSTVAICYLFAALFERTLGSQRQMLRTALGALRRRRVDAT